MKKTPSGGKKYDTSTDDDGNDDEDYKDEEGDDADYLKLVDSNDDNVDKDADQVGDRYVSMFCVRILLLLFIYL